MDVAFGDSPWVRAWGRLAAMDDGRDRWLSKRRKRHLRRWVGEERAVGCIHARTFDDVELVLTRYSRAPTRNVPVVLCHGIGSNRFTFDLSAELSLAAYLAELDFDVYALELRGHGRSQKAQQGTLRFGWGLFTYAWRDLPAAFDALYGYTGHRKVHWVGHSMGGILALIHLAACSKAGEPSRLKSLVTVASSVDYSGTASLFHGASRLAFLSPRAGRVGALPAGFLARLLAPIAGRAVTPFDRGLIYPPNIEREVFQRWLAVGAHAISGRVLRDLATAFNDGGVRDGDACYAAHLPGDAPTLAIAGTRDTQCAPEAAGRGVHELRTLGRDFGHQNDYGHFDLLLGTHARTECWPLIAAWLIQHD
ncbi:MAG: alpha/beta fold hydrolase [Myxococcota bacterium]